MNERATERNGSAALSADISVFLYKLGSIVIILLYSCYNIDIKVILWYSTNRLINMMGWKVDNGVIKGGKTMKMNKKIVILLSMVLLFNAAAGKVFASQLETGNVKRLKEECHETDGIPDTDNRNESAGDRNMEENGVLGSSELDSSCREECGMVNITEICILIGIVSLYIAGICITDRYYSEK